MNNIGEMAIRISITKIEILFLKRMEKRSYIKIKVTHALQIWRTDIFQSEPPKTLKGKDNTLIL